jgi:hypothetical protein
VPAAQDFFHVLLDSINGGILAAILRPGALKLILQLLQLAFRLLISRVRVFCWAFNNCVLKVTSTVRFRPKTSFSVRRPKPRVAGIDPDDVSALVRWPSDLYAG